MAAFDAYLWRFVDGRRLHDHGRRRAPRAHRRVRRAEPGLKRRGFSFVGTTICYAFMQAVGMVNDHEKGCFRRARSVAKTPAGRGIPPDSVASWNTSQMPRRCSTNPTCTRRCANTRSACPASTPPSRRRRISRESSSPATRRCPTATAAHTAWGGRIRHVHGDGRGRRRGMARPGRCPPGPGERVRAGYLGWIEQLHERAAVSPCARARCIAICRSISTPISTGSGRSSSARISGIWRKPRRPGLYDTLSHPGPRQEHEPRRVESAAHHGRYSSRAGPDRQAGTAMELNTSGLNKTIPEMNPGLEILRGDAAARISRWSSGPTRTIPGGSVTVTRRRWRR